MEKPDSEIKTFAMISECNELLKREPNLIYVELTGQFIQRYPKYDPKKGIIETAKRIYQKIIEGNI